MECRDLPADEPAPCAVARPAAAAGPLLGHAEPYRAPANPGPQRRPRGGPRGTAAVPQPHPRTPRRDAAPARLVLPQASDPFDSGRTRAGGDLAAARDAGDSPAPAGRLQPQPA